MLEVNNMHRCKGWTRPEDHEGYVMGDVAIPIGFEDANFTGALMPDGSPVKQSMGNTCGWEYGGGGSYPSCLGFACCILPPMMCSNADICGACCCGCPGRTWAFTCNRTICAPCMRPACGCGSFHPALDMDAAGASAETFNGHDLEYIDDEQYRVWPFWGNDKHTAELAMIKAAPHDQEGASAYAVS